MPDQFSLTIELGNDAMQSTTDVADALRAVADYIAGIGDLPDGDWHLDAGSVRDMNGNTVGSWEVE
jgi:hypothetical protein